MTAFKELEKRFEAISDEIKRDADEEKQDILKKMHAIIRKARHVSERFAETLRSYQEDDDEFAIGGGESDSHSAFHYNSVMHDLTNQFSALEAQLLSY